MCKSCWFARDSSRKHARFWHTCHATRAHACTFMFVHLHRKVRPFPLVSSGLNESDKSEKVGISHARKLFSHPRKKYRARTFSKSWSEFSKNCKSAFFKFFENINLFHFRQLFSKMFGSSNFCKCAHIFSFPRLLSVQMRACFPNSRVKKPQIQVIPHDDMHLSRDTCVACHTGANMRPRKIRTPKFGWACRKIRGFRKTEVNQGRVSRVRKTPEVPNFSFDKPLLLSSSIFQFFILPKCTLWCTFFCTIFPFWSANFCEAPFFHFFNFSQFFQFVHFLHFLISRFSRADWRGNEKVNRTDQTCSNPGKTREMGWIGGSELAGKHARAWRVSCVFTCAQTCSNMFRSLLFCARPPAMQKWSRPDNFCSVPVRVVKKSLSHARNMRGSTFFTSARSVTFITFVHLHRKVSTSFDKTDHPTCSELCAQHVPNEVKWGAIGRHLSAQTRVREALRSPSFCVLAVSLVSYFCILPPLVFLCKLTKMIASYKNVRSVQNKKTRVLQKSFHVAHIFFTKTSQFFSWKCTFSKTEKSCQKLYFYFSFFKNVQNFENASSSSLAPFPCPTLLLSPEQGAGGCPRLPSPLNRPCFLRFITCVYVTFVHVRCFYIWLIKELW